ncbi:MAG: restriction endonuclease subunit S [Ignavibacteriaceae bacterium]|nr:restriction endonuclease subunit S [Ignavibacteriaceae bacterium]
MIEWKECNFGEIAEIIMGQSPQGESCNSIGKGIPLLNGPTEFTNKFPVPIQFTVDAKRLSRKGDILFCVRGSTTGKMNWSDKEYAIGRGLAAIRHKTSNDAQFFIRGVLDYYLPIILGGATGSTFPNVSGDELRRIKVIVPPLPEQRAIAEVLSSLDDKIDLLHRQNKTLEQIAETLFRQWFVEEAEEGWEERTVGDEFDYIMGQSPAGDTLNDTKDGIPFYQGRSDFGFRFPERRMYTTSPTRIANSFDVLISVRAPVGDMNVALEDCCIGRGVAAFRYKFNSKYYTYTYYKLRTLKEKIKSFEDNGTVFGSIGKEDIKKIESIIPPSNIISEYQNMAKPIDEKIILNTHQIRTLTQLRDTLLPKLMSGEVRVR